MKTSGNKRLVSLDVCKATAVVIVIVLHAITVSGLKLERNGALIGFEMMSGLFHELTGVGVARSVCRALNEGRTKCYVLSRLLCRALILMGASVALGVLTAAVLQNVVEPLVDSADNSAARWLSFDINELLRRGVIDISTLTFHGACQLLAAPILLWVVRAPDCDGEQRRVASAYSAVALLCCAFLLLTFSPQLQSLADAATCCVPDHAVLGYHGLCEQDGGAFKTKPPKSGAAYPMMRVPSSCMRVVGNGSDHESFDPCDFTAIGPPYLPPCAEGETPPDWPPCQRVTDLNKAGGEKHLCEIYPSASHAANSPHETLNARKRCLGTLFALTKRLENTGRVKSEYATALREGLDSASLGTIWCPLVSTAVPTEAFDMAALLPPQAVVATINPVRSPLSLVVFLTE